MKYFESTKHDDCMGFFHRQIPMFVNEFHPEVPECLLKAYYSKTKDEELPTLRKLDDALNKLLSNY